MPPRAEIEVVHPRGSRIRPVGERFGVFTRSAVRIDRADLPYIVHVDLEDEGQPVCRALRMEQREGGAPITAEGVRRIPVGEVFRLAADDTNRFLVGTKGGGYGPPMRAEDVRAFMRANRADRKRGRRRIPDEELRRVAEVYRYALATGQPPTATVAQEMRISRSSAGRWVMKARDAGHLGPAIPGQKGEQR